MTASEQIFITKIDPKDRIILLEFKKQENGQTIDCKGKAFKSAEPHLKLNTKMDAVVEWEVKEGFPPGWVVKPVAAQGGGGGFKGGGAAKSDPEKNKNIADCNANNNASIRFSNSLNNAVKITEMACLLVGKGGDLNQVRAISDDLTSITLDIQKRLSGE